MRSFKDARTVYELKYDSAPTYDVEKQVFYYVHSYFDVASEAYCSDIRAYDLKTKMEQTLIANGGENFAPSVQKNRLLYISKNNDIPTPQVVLYDFETETERVITDATHGVQYVEWIPNSDAFVFTTSLPVSDEAVEMSDAYSRRITSLNYQADGTGFLDEERSNFLCEQNMNDENYTVIGQQSTGYALRRIISFSADGRYIYYEGRVEPNSAWNQDSAVFSYDRESQQIEKITQQFDEGIFSEAAPSPNGKYIAMVGSELPYETNNQFSLYLYNTETKTMENVSEGLDIQFADNSVSDVYRRVSKPIVQWHPNSTHFYVQTSEYGDVFLNKVALSGEMTRISENDQVLKEYLVLDNRQILAAVSKYNKPFSWQVFNGEEWTSLETETENYYNQYRYGNYEEVQYTAEDGGVVHGFLVYPTDYEVGKKYPLILNIHGGPYTMHAANFYHEAQYMASNGYAVLLINPRGSYGYGQTHVTGVYERYGKEDFTDLMTAVSGVCKDHAFVDEDNLFVTGGSYGGYMTNWIVTQDHRFKAAASQRSMANFISLFGTSDIGYFFFRDQTGADISEADKLWAISPQAHAEKVKTPLLLLHPLNDYRCPFEQAQQFYTTLKYYDKEAEMLVFYNASHELSRSGHPEQRIRRLEGIVGWFDKYYDGEN